MHRCEPCRSKKDIFLAACGFVRVQVEAAFAQNVTTNWHHYGVAPTALATLAPGLVVLSTNVALNGQRFVSSVEGRNGVPIYGTQFHPESVQWDAGDLRNGQMVPARTLPAVRSVQYLANFFVQQVNRLAASWHTGSSLHRFRWSSHLFLLPNWDAHLVLHKSLQDFASAHALIDAKIVFANVPRARACVWGGWHVSRFFAACLSVIFKLTAAPCRHNGCVVLLGAEQFACLPDAEGRVAGPRRYCRNARD